MACARCCLLKGGGCERHAVLPRRRLTCTYSFPVPRPSPPAMQRMAHGEGELATARATARQGTIMTLSSWSTTSVEDVAKAAPGPKWFQ